MPKDSLHHEIFPTLAGVVVHTDVSRDKALGILSELFQAFSDGDLALVKDFLNKIEGGETGSISWRYRQEVRSFLSHYECWVGRSK
jgi:hypothetical protein